MGASRTALSQPFHHPPPRLRYDAAKSGGVAIDPEARAAELETAIFTQYGKSNIKPAPVMQHTAT